MFQIGDVVETVLEGYVGRNYPDWNGLVGTIDKVFSSGTLFRIRFPHIVPNEPHDDPYILQLGPNLLRLARREPDWEI